MSRLCRVGRGTRGKRAKRTQFRCAAWHGHPARGPESWARCPCHGDAGRRRQEPVRDLGTIVQNKANRRRRRAGWGSCTNKPNSCHYAGQEIGVPGRAKHAKRTQFSPALAARQRAKDVKRTQFTWSAGVAETEMRKTKPISGGQGTPPFQYSIASAFQSGAGRAKRTQFLSLCRSGDWRSQEGEACETNPISRLRISDCGLGTDLRRNAPCDLPPRPCAGQSCKTNPIPATMPIGRSAFPGEQSVQNEPNFPARPGGTRPQGRGTRGKCAKRTQSGPAWAGPERDERKMQNEPNWLSGRCRARACPELAEGTPNPRRADGQSCKTKPIGGQGAARGDIPLMGYSLD